MRSDLLVIQYLRGIAAVGVLAFHAAQRAGQSFGVGAAGVDIFFVISGFIMWTISARQAHGPGTFLLRRAGRIAPLYWTVTLAVVALDLLKPALFPNMRLSAGHVVQSLLFLPHQDPHGVTAPVIVPGWTLNYEVFFYVVFALTLLLPLARRALALTGALVLFCALGLMLDVSGNPVLATYSDPLVLEFVAGVWLAKAWAANRLGGRAAAWTAIATGCAILATVAILDPVVAGAPRLLYWGLPAVLIVWGGLSLERSGRTPHWSGVKLLGDASYSIYLVHGLALSLVFKLLEGRGPGSAAVALLVAIPFSILVGTACYFAVERPLLAIFHPGRRKAGVRASTSAPAAALTAKAAS